jgi:hypothetical protein
MEINITGIKKNFNGGELTHISVSYQSYDGEEVFSAQVVVKQEDLTDESLLSNSSDSDFDKIARKKIKSWL